MHTTRPGIRFLTVAGIIAALIVAVFPLQAQQAQQRGSVSGVVRAAATQRPITGAVVTIVGTNLAALTNADGRFLIPNVRPGDIRVTAEILGYRLGTQTARVEAGATATVDFSLAESAIALDAMVVTGTAGQARKREIGNSISTISSSELENAPVRNTQDIIGARATGVTVVANSGQPGSGAAVRLRGNNSIAMSNEPLVYVDGVRMFSRVAPASGAARQGTSPINDIAPDDIDRIEIVKGAAATTLYGTEASGGVIQIFTKRGLSGEPVWTFEASGGFSNMGRIGPKGDPTGLFLKQCSGANLVTSVREIATNQFDPNGLRFEDATCPSSGTWLRNGRIQRYNGSVRGGGSELTYYFSGAFNEEQGVIAPGGAKDGGFRGNFSFRPRPTLDLTLSTAYTLRKIGWIPDGNLANGFTLNVMRGPNNNFKDATKCTTPGVTCLVNAEILKQDIRNDNDHFITGLTARWEPNDKIAQRFTFGYDYNHADNISILPFAFARAPLGQILVQNWNHTTLSLDYVGTFRHALRGLSSSLSWGGQLFEDRNRQTNTNSADFSGPTNPTLESGARRSITFDERLRVINAGFFAQEMLGISDRLFLTGGVRIDGNSAFGESFGLQVYPKISASYVLSDHAFWPTDTWETLKLRGAIGEAGKAPGAFDASRTWEPIAADEGKPGFTPQQLGNEDLGPERTREVELGFESSAFKGRLGAEFTYFNKRTIDALVQVRYPPSQGFSNRQLENIGELQNTGIEVRLDGGLITMPNFNWRVRLNYSTIKSKAVDLGGEEVSLGNNNWVREGMPVPGLFGVFVRNANEFADPVISPDTLIGPQYPTRIIGIGTSFTLFNDLVIDFLGEFQGGHYLQNFTGFQNANRFVWRPCYEAQQALVAAAAGNTAALANFNALERARCAIDRTKQDSDFFIEKADFFKLRSTSLSYRIPQRWVRGARSAQLTLAARNLIKITDYSGIDPEVADLGDSGLNGLSRREYYNLPPTRSFIASLRVTF